MHLGFDSHASRHAANVLVFATAAISTGLLRLPRLPQRTPAGAGILGLHPVTVDGVARFSRLSCRSAGAP